MKREKRLKCWLFLFSVLLIFGCSEDGLKRDEARLVKSGKATEKMRLFTVDDSSDSLFLRQPTRKIEKESINSKLITLLRKRMLATVTDIDNEGVGIAAPQVGVGVKLILVQRFDKEGEPIEPYFNPEIKMYGDSVNAGFEGCLSVPRYRGSVSRSQNIEVSYLDSMGKKQREEINGFVAVIFQHEIDHLSGVMYFDHVFGGYDALLPYNEE